MSNHLIKHLKKIFPAEEYGRVIRALRNDAIIWRAFQDIDLSNQMIELAGTQITKWTPAFLALVALEIPEKYQSFRSKSEPGDENIRYRAAADLERLTTHPHFDISSFSIEEAGMAALALRERWVILSRPDITLFKEHPNQTIWKAVSACLVGLIPKPEEFIRELMISHSSELRAIAIHAVSTNPFEEEQISKILLPAIRVLPAIERIEILRQCSQTNTQLAVYLANQLLDQFKIIEPNASNNPIELIQDFVEMSELLKITGQYEQALPALEKLWHTTTSLQTDLTAQLAQAAAKANNQDAAVKAIDKIFQIEDHLQADDRANIALAQIHTGKVDTHYLEDSKFQSSQAGNGPATLVAKAQLALKNSDQSEAQNLAYQAYESTCQYLRDKESLTFNISSTINPDFIQTLILLLLDLELVIEAGNLCELALAKLPNNSDIIYLYSKAANMTGDTILALENAQIAVALEPVNNTYRLELIELLISQNSWQEALKEAEVYHKQLTQPSAQDYILLASCYLNNDHTDEATLAANQGLSQDPNSGELHALLGSIYQKDSRFGEAIKHLNKAILLEPQMTEFWSSLSELYSLQANPDKAEEILKSAFEVNPRSAHLHLQLGKIFYEYHKPEEALAEFQKAKEFISLDTNHDTRQEIYRFLGNSLSIQGYQREALEILEEGHQAFPVNPEIAHQYGKALFREGRIQAALSAYQIASQKSPKNVEVLLDHSRAFLAEGTKTKEALKNINQALALDPDNPLGTALLAEATAQTGDHAQAIRMYQQVMLSDLVNDPEWRETLATNLAQSAFALNQPEIAIAFLQDTLQSVPESLKVKQTLCQAFIQTDLTKDALKILDDILENNTQNLEILMWAADQAMIINDLEFAAKILNQAKQISPHKADILVRLGYIQLEGGDEELARKTFGQLFAAENVDVKNLRLAAQALIGLGDISSSIPYLEKALELSDYKSSDLLKELTKLHLKSGNNQAALETINKQIKIQPMLPRLYVTQADIYYRLSQPKSAVNSMMKALELSPDSADLHSKTAYLLRKNQDLPGSLFHIKQAVGIDDSDPKINLQAAQIFQACLLESQAIKQTESLIDLEKPSLSAYLLQAELILDLQSPENLKEVETLVTRAAELASSHPRLLAIQSRLLYLTGDIEKAQEVFEQSMLNLSASETDELDPINLSTIQISIAKTAITLQRWDVALFFSREAQQLTPHEPYPYFLQAMIYTRRAESKSRFEAIKKHDPFPPLVATHQVSQDAFLLAIKSAEAYSPDPDAGEVLARWRARGELAILNGNPMDYIELLSEKSEDFAALLAAICQADLVPDIDLSLHLEDAEVSFQRALYAAKADTEHAFSLAEKLVQQEPNNPDYAALYAIFAQSVDHHQVALNSIEHALSLSPNEPHWHSMAGDLNIILGKFEAAITHFEMALKIDPDNPSHLFKLGKAYTAGNSPGNAIRVLEQATKINPIDAECWVALAVAYNMVGNHSYAMDAIKQALKLSPNNLTNLLAASEIAIAAGQHDYCAELIDRAAKLPVRSSEDIIRISNVMVSIDRLNEALEYLNQKIDLSFDQVSLQIQKAQLIGMLEGNDQKMGILINLAKEYPNNPLVFAHLTDAYIEANNTDEAVRSAQYALKNAGNALDFELRTKLHYQLGVLQRQAGQLDQALHQLSQALQLSPNFLSAHLEIGETLSQRKEFVKALEHYQMAIEIAPQDPRPYKEAGLLLKESKDYAAAEAMFRQAYSLDSNDIFIQRQLATVIALALIHQPNANRFSHGKSKNK